MPDREELFVLPIRFTGEKVMVHLGHMIDALQAAGYRIVGPGEGTEIHRYPTHHVLLQETHFITEHPPTCDLASCTIHERAAEAWGERPGGLGWWEVDENLDLSPAGERHTYLLIPIDEEEG